MTIEEVEAMAKISCVDVHWHEYADEFDSGMRWECMLTPEDVVFATGRIVRLAPTKEEAANKAWEAYLKLREWEARR